MCKILVNGPHLHEYLHEMNRQTWRNRDFLTVGEAWSASPEDARQYSDEQREELSMVFNSATYGLIARLAAKSGNSDHLMLHN